MELYEIYKKDDSNQGLKISFEVFPPKDGDISSLFEELRILKKYNPVLVSLTYGAGANSGKFKIEDMKSLQDLELNLMPHFTCIRASKKEIDNHIRLIENLGIENILALRGDIPKGLDLSELEFKYASDLVQYIESKSTLAIGVAGYPEGHIECPDIETDIKNLKIKTDKGACAIFTQLFFDNEKFYRFCEKVNSAGIDLPIIPGIMPIINLAQIQKMTTLAKITIPKDLKEKLEKFPNNTKEIGLDFGIKQCQNLIENGVQHMHFFTLNKSEQTAKILENIE